MGPNKSGILDICFRFQYPMPKAGLVPERQEASQTNACYLKKNLQ